MKKEVIIGMITVFFIGMLSVFLLNDQTIQSKNDGYRHGLYASASECLTEFQSKIGNSEIQTDSMKVVAFVKGCLASAKLDIDICVKLQEGKFSNYVEGQCGSLGKNSGACIIGYEHALRVCEK